MTTVRQQPPPGSFSAMGLAVNALDVSTERGAPFSWDDWFRHASPQQRVEALGLAQQQGLLYPHQLPISSNGVKPTAAVKETELSALLAKLLIGKAAPLPALLHRPITHFDSGLDDLQKQAVSRALHTPDTFLLQGLPGTGKSRVVAEIILQFAAQGRRVLFLAGHSASLDVVLERFVGRPEVFALRLLDAAEKVETLPPWLRGFTLEEQKQAFLERVLAGARHNREHFESSCRRRSEQASLWGDLLTCAAKYQELNENRQAIQARAPGIAEAVERDLSGANSTCALIASVNELETQKDRDLQEWNEAIKQKQDAVRQHLPENTARATRIAELEPAYQAKTQRRFFSFAYWANWFNGGIVHEMERLRGEQAAADAIMADRQREIASLQQHGHDRRAKFDQERDAIVRAEIDARNQALTDERRANEDEQRALDEQWNSLCTRLNQPGLEHSTDAILAAQQIWLTHKKHDEQQCQFARQWTDFVESAGPQLATRLPSLANVVAGTTQRWHADPKLREAVSAPFDLVIVEDAESLMDADLQKLSRLAPRCTLVRHLLTENVPAGTNAEKASRAHAIAPLAAVASWHRLWQALGGDVWLGPYAWRRDHGRLVCQLLPLAQADHTHLETEGLADAPDIELRILHAPDATPRLAQVIFGQETSFADAFAFLMREIQEFPLEPLACTGWWLEQKDCLCLNFGHQRSAVETWLTLEPGVRVGVYQSPTSETPRIACIAFEPGAGWDRCKAEAWLQRHRPVQDHGRTVYLQTPYRFSSPLATFIQTVVQTPDWQPVHSSAPHHAARPMEFIAVPVLANHDWPREGAGLELDLSASRHADRLPVGLRQGLPPRGFVNYLEAQALIRRLESWLETEATGTPRRIAVLALYQGQVDLLRRLAEQSECLRSRAVPLEITLPSRMRQRECDVAFLSLTRSHGHRATAFGEAVEELPIALTRACERLFVFGDPGTLQRRTQWTGPVDQLDNSAAQQELLRVKRLVACLQANAHPANANGKGSPHA